MGNSMSILPPFPGLRDRDGDKKVEDFVLLGEAYVRKGVSSKNGRDFTKASALYNAALVRCRNWAKRQNLIERIKSTESLLLQHVAGLDHAEISSRKDDVAHKITLQKIRLRCQKQLQDIHELCNYSGNPLHCAKTREEEEKRAEKIRALYQQISREMKAFVSDLIQECFLVLGPPPCNYAAIGLGSLAREEMTPYSDLEFAVLLEERERLDNEKAYFRSMTYLLHLKVLNLGETILPSMCIEELSDYNDMSKEQFYDSVTPHGFSFDGCMPWASKTPLGRDETDTKPGLELIMTPREMADVQTMNRSLREGYHLADVLRTATLIKGDQSLVDEYRQAVFDILDSPVSDVDNTTVGQKMALQTLSEDVNLFDPTALHDPSRSGFGLLFGCAYDVKKMIFRLISCTMQSIGLLSSTKCDRLEDILLYLEQRGLITSLVRHNIRIAAAIADELRLKTYVANRGQKELISTLPKFEQKNTNFPKTGQLFYLQQNPDMLHRFYFTSYPYHETMKTVIRNANESGYSTLEGMISSSFPDSGIYDNSPLIRGLMYFDFFEYDKAEECFLDVLKDNPGNRVALWNLLQIYALTHRYSNMKDVLMNSSDSLSAISDVINDNSIDFPGLLASAFGQNPFRLRERANEDTASDGSTEHSPVHSSTEGEEDSAIMCVLKAFLPAIAGDFAEAESSLEQVMKIKEKWGSDEEPSSVYSRMAHTIDLVVGGIYFNLKNYEKCVFHLELGLKYLQTLYGSHSAHPLMSYCFLLLSRSHKELSNHEMAKAMMENARTCSRASLSRGAYGYYSLGAIAISAMDGSENSSRHFGMVQQAADAGMALKFAAHLHINACYVSAVKCIEEKRMPEAAWYYKKLLWYVLELDRQEPHTDILRDCVHFVSYHGLAYATMITENILQNVFPALLSPGSLTRLSSSAEHKSESRTDKPNRRTETSKLVLEYERLLDVYRLRYGHDCDIYMLPFIGLLHTLDGNASKGIEWIFATLELLESLKTLPANFIDLFNVPDVERTAVCSCF
ncbi:PREDICTED: uncharacterized protein LOC109486835 [Branchiostoma belcheri]|uniref:Uncharacterized protein LOC109486835 n=1 Tax=Branchiostoma belcheri TaxID=7741 RepID=A0A6P5A9L9_BRABE|nr:PREDICTED: uncharacterized protein LOC109486835 [Branchiostoma belcheri]